MSDKTHWEDCYRNEDTPWDKGEPSPGLVDFLASHPDLERGRVCVPGCGMGHDALALAAAGFDVTGVDIAPTCVERATRHAVSKSGSVRFELADFLNTSPETPFDWIFEHTFYCAIQPEWREAYRAAIQRWLKPGGQWLAVHYLIPDEDGPPFGTTREEVVERFTPHFDLVEDWMPRSYPNRTGLERMFWWRQPRQAS